MTRIFNVQQLKERRRELRKNQTPAEKVVWQYLRRKNILGVQFYRQYGIGFYIADFYAPKIKLCIEIDGDQHYTTEGKMYDNERDNFMNSLGIQIIRFKNSEVLNNISKVIDEIGSSIEKLVENSSAVSLMTKGEHKKM